MNKIVIWYAKAAAIIAGLAAAVALFAFTLPWSFFGAMAVCFVCGLESLRRYEDRFRDD